jgi:putative ATPase
MDAALALAEKTAHLPVPLHLRNAPTELMQSQGHGVGYQYTHDFPNHFVQQDYLPPELKGQTLYQPAENARERDTARVQAERWGKAT